MELTTITPAVTTLATVIFLLVALLGALHKTKTAIAFYLLQSLALTATIVIVAVTNHIDHLFLAALLSLAVKVVIIPRSLRRASNVIHTRLVVGTYVTAPITMLLSAVIVTAALSISHHDLPNFPASAQLTVALAGATVLMSLFLMISRKGVLSQMIGLLSMENGITLGALLIAGSFPVVVELGILFDLAMWSIIGVLFLYKIFETVGSTDTTELATLTQEETL